VTEALRVVLLATEHGGVGGFPFSDTHAPIQIRQHGGSACHEMKRKREDEHIPTEVIQGITNIFDKGGLSDLNVIKYLASEAMKYSESRVLSHMIALVSKRKPCEQLRFIKAMLDNADRAAAKSWGTRCVPVSMYLELLETVPGMFPITYEREELFENIISRTNRWFMLQPLVLLGCLNFPWFPTQRVWRGLQPNAAPEDLWDDTMSLPWEDTMCNIQSEIYETLCRKWHNEDTTVAGTTAVRIMTRVVPFRHRDRAAVLLLARRDAGSALPADLFCYIVKHIIAL